MKVDYLIIGQGLAGSLMAFELIERGKKIVVYDQPKNNHSSLVAAGLINPITGRKFVKTWKADLLFPYLHDYYPKAEKQLGSRFFYKLPLFRPFMNIEEQNDVIAKSNKSELGDYIEDIIPEKKALRISNPFGGVFLRHTGYLNIPEFINSVSTLIKSKGILIHERFNEKKMHQGKDSIKYQDFVADKVIYCDGISAKESMFFNWLPFRPVKGELIFITFAPPFEFIFNRNVFILPYKNNIHKAGATYDWENIDIIPTDEGKRIIKNKLNAILDVNFKTVDHMAGIRPATKDRRPFIGLHPKYENIGIFNGLGSKGVSLGPYFAKKLSDCMECRTEIESDANIKRYISLY